MIECIETYFMFCIDGGMTKLMIYHNDHGWTYTPGK